MIEIYRYPPLILEALAHHGLRRLATPPPQKLRDAVRDLSRHEIRTIRGRLLEGRIERRHYAAHIVALRQRYRLLSIPLQLWTTDAPAAPGAARASIDGRRGTTAR